MVILHYHVMTEKQKLMGCHGTSPLTSVI